MLDNLLSKASVLTVEECDILHQHLIPLFPETPVLSY